MIRIALIFLLLAAGCDCGGRSEDVGTASSALRSDERVLDVSDDGRVSIVGVPRPVPENTDAPLVHDVRLRGSKAVWPKDLPAQDARFLPDGRVAVVDGSSQLWLVDLAGKRELLEETARPGIDASAACACLVYLRGDGPDAVPVVFDLKTKASRVVAADLAPAWLPVIALDGASFFIVSARSGLPAIWRVPLAGGAPRPLVPEERASKDPLHPDPFPSGPERPRVFADRLEFRSGDETVAVGFDGRVLSRRGAP